jgi:hypothetical protein
MSWWDTSNGTIGDRPADIVRGALQQLSNGSQKPSLAALLGGTAAALRGGGAAIVSDDAAKVTRLTAVISKNTKRISGAAGDQADPAITSTMRRAFDEISRTYLEQFQRKPTTKELLEGMAFVLRYKPDELLSGVDGQSVDEIVIDAKS